MGCTGCTSCAFPLNRLRVCQRARVGCSHYIQITIFDCILVYHIEPLYHMPRASVPHASSLLLMIEMRLEAKHTVLAFTC